MTFSQKKLTSCNFSDNIRNPVNLFRCKKLDVSQYMCVCFHLICIYMYMYMRERSSNYMKHFFTSRAGKLEGEKANGLLKVRKQTLNTHLSSL